MDYDVEVLGLANPPTSAVVTSYRPAVSIRNNGIHDAIASGYVRIYAAGLLIFESEVYSNTIDPGETGTAEAIYYWTPPAQGTYMIQGYVSTPLDQVEPNNNLNPTTVIVGPGQPPVPPTPVTPHAAQHEEDGADEVSLEGLRGRAADAQTPINHASDHEQAGSDPVNVTNMPGVLAEAQLPVPHAAWHETGGVDPLNVVDIPGADALEYRANKGQPAGYAGLDIDGIVPSAQVQKGTAVPDPGDDEDDLGLRFDRNMGYVLPKAHAAKHDRTGSDPIAGQIPTWGIIIWDSRNPTPDGWQLCPVFPAIPPPFITLSYMGLP